VVSAASARPKVGAGDIRQQRVDLLGSRAVRAVFVVELAMLPFFLGELGGFPLMSCRETLIMAEGAEK
jgi:hypothetical protein